MPVSTTGSPRAGFTHRLLPMILALLGLIVSCRELDVTAVQVNQVVVNPNPASVAVGQNRQLAAIVTDAAGNQLRGRTIIWATLDGNIATVDGNGQVRGLTTGSTTVTATAEGRTGAATIDVIGTAVATVEVEPSTLTLRPGEDRQLQAVAKSSNGTVLPGHTATWISRNPGVAHVDNVGVVTGGVLGTTTIVATIEGRTGEASVTVGTEPVASVVVLPSTATVEAGTTRQLEALLRAEDGSVLTGRAVTWSTGNASIAEVNRDGLVRGIAVGNTTITATSEGKSGQANVQVTPRTVAAVEVQPASASLIVGETIDLDAVGLAADGTPLPGRSVTWSSSDPSVASVSQNGGVTGQAVGAVTITATIDDVAGTAQVFVAAQPVATVEVKPPSADVIAGDSILLTADPKAADGTSLPNRIVTWGTSDPAVATVSPRGGYTAMVHALTVGGVTITATVEGQAGTAALGILAPPITAVEIAPNAASVLHPGAQQFQATVRSGTTVITNRQVQWRSLTPTVAGDPVPTGLLTATATTVGTPCLPPAQSCDATIEASVDNIVATATLTVLKPIATIEVSPQTLRLEVGASEVVQADVRALDTSPLASRAVAWASASASSNVTVQSVPPFHQTATITAVAAACPAIVCVEEVIVSAEGIADTVVVTVLQPVTDVDISPDDPTLVEGDKIAVKAVVSTAAGPVVDRLVTWSVSDPACATVVPDPSSTFQQDAELTAAVPTGVPSCTAWLRATAGGVTDSTSVTVVKAIASVDFLPASLDLLPNASEQVTVIPRAADGTNLSSLYPVSWSGSNPATVTVTSTGLVEAFGVPLPCPNTMTSCPDTVVATVGGQAYDYVVRVLKPVHTVVLTPDPVDTLAVTATVQFTATLNAADGTNLTGTRTLQWVSDAPLTATITQAGLLEATGASCTSTDQTCPATITVTAEGVSDQVVVNVLKPVHTVLVTPGSATLSTLLLNPDETFTAELRAEDGTVLTARTVTWTWTETVTGLVTLNPTTGYIITVTKQGLLTGTVVLTATSEGKTSPPVTITVIL